MRTNGTAKAAASHGEAASRVATYAYPPQRSAGMISTKGCSSRLIGIPAAIMKPGNEPSATYLRASEIERDPGGASARPPKHHPVSGALFCIGEKKVRVVGFTP